MRKKILLGLITVTAIGFTTLTPTLASTSTTTQSSNKVLMSNTTILSNQAVVINGNSKLYLYKTLEGKGVIGNLSVGEKLTLLQGQCTGYCKVKVQSTGAIGYVDMANMKHIGNTN